MNVDAKCEEREGRCICRLEDRDTGASASILASYGFNLFDLRLPVAGKVRPIVYASETFADAPAQPGRNGMPVLFPFANRIRDGRFTFEGRTFQLARNKPPHAIHGFAIDVPWRVIEVGTGPDGAFAEGRFRLSEQAPAAIDLWPADAELTLRYTLLRDRLTLDATVSNPDAKPLPWGFGLHSYFFSPFSSDADPETARVVLPASRWWMLEESLPTGEVRSVGEMPALDFRAGRSRSGQALDDVFTGLEYDASSHAAFRLIDGELGWETRVRFDRTIREIVAFTPPPPIPGRVIALEPYTHATDAINLAAQGIDAGLRVLAPGESHRFRIEFATCRVNSPVAGEGGPPYDG